MSSNAGQPFYSLIRVNVVLETYWLFCVSLSFYLLTILTERGSASKGKKRSPVTQKEGREGKKTKDSFFWYSNTWNCKTLCYWRKLMLMLDDDGCTFRGYDCCSTNLSENGPERNWDIWGDGEWGRGNEGGKEWGKKRIGGGGEGVREKREWKNHLYFWRQTALFSIVYLRECTCTQLSFLVQHTSSLNATCMYLSLCVFVCTDPVHSQCNKAFEEGTKTLYFLLR